MGKREKWFANLPDEFTGTEVALRESIVEFLDTWNGDTPPTLSIVGSLEVVKKARIDCLPKYVSLRDWVDLRVGGEIEIVPSDHSTEVFFGYRGKLDYEAIRRMDESHKERKLQRERDGEDGKGKGKGKADGKGKRGPPPVGKGKGKGKNDEPP